MDSKDPAKEKPTSSRKPYSSPRLVAYGNLEQLTKAKPGRAVEGSGHTPKVPSCWIAEVLYGADDPRTHLLRSWLTQVYSVTCVGSVVVYLYIVFGRQVAPMVRRSSLLRGALQPLFDAGVSRALRDYCLHAAVGS